MIKKIIRKFTKSVDLQPLQYLAAMSVGISVCESEEVQRMIGTFRKTIGNDGKIGFSEVHWEKLCGKIKRKLKQYGIPDIIIGVILENLWPIGFQIFRWIVYHAEDTGIDCSSHFCWTPQFKIDYQKTAKILVQNEALDIKKRFKLACFYCLDLEVRSLWGQMNLPEKRFFFKRGNLNKSRENPIVFYWTYYIQDVPLEYWDCKILNYTRLLKYAVENGYLRATRLFIGKLKENMRNRMISNCLDIHLRKLYELEYIKKDHLEIACFLIDQLSFVSGSITRSTIALSLTFLHFLEWPMQKHFMTVVHRLRRVLTKYVFGKVLEGILVKVTGCFKDHDYKELFREFWHRSSEECKTYVRTESEIGYVIVVKFVEHYFGFVFQENYFVLKEKFRSIVFEQEGSEDEAYFEKDNVEFFRFLVRERVTTKSFIERHRYQHFLYFRFENYFNLPMGELLYLIDGILDIV